MTFSIAFYESYVSTVLMVTFPCTVYCGFCTLRELENKYTMYHVQSVQSIRTSNIQDIFKILVF